MDFQKLRRVCFSRDLSVVLALLIAGFPYFSSIFMEDETWRSLHQGWSSRYALHFLRNSPTFRFDGIPDSIKVEGVETLRMT